MSSESRSEQLTREQLMRAHARPERPACDLDARNSAEQARHLCTSHPTEKTGPVELNRNVRSEQAARELYQNRFPAEH